MNQEKFGKMIKEIREKNHLTQKDLADKYGVTYQAVSKWERGQNLPDISLIREISRDFNVSIDSLIDGNWNAKKRAKDNLLLIILLIVILGIGTFFILRRKDDDLHSRPIKTTCDDFNIYGLISYNESKSAIYIPKIEYCGNDKNISFEKIECSLYEKNGDTIKKISSYNYSEKEEITLDNFLKKVSFNVDNYLKMCKDYSDNLYLEIKGQAKGNNYFYHIPLIIEDDSCHST